MEQTAESDINSHHNDPCSAHNGSGETLVQNAIKSTISDREEYTQDKRSKEYNEEATQDSVVDGDLDPRIQVSKISIWLGLSRPFDFAIVLRYQNLTYITYTSFLDRAGKTQ